MPKDWNAVSESGSSSSQEEEYVENEEQQEPSESKSQKSKSESQSQTQTQKQQTQVTKPIEQHKQRPKFMSDEELIQKIKSKQLDERRKIKIVNLKSQDLLQQIKSHKLITYFKDVIIGDRPPFYIASFKTEEDLIEFIQQKIDNRYRFFLHPYIKSARDIEREEKYKQRRGEEEKEREKHRGDKREEKETKEDGRRRGRNRPEYDEEVSQETKEKERRREPRSERQVEVKPQRQPQSKSHTRIEQPKQLSSQLIKEPKQQKPTPIKQQNKAQQPVKPHTEPKQFNYEIQKNQIRIKSNIYSKNRIADEVVYRKITDKWDRIKIYVKKEGLDKVYELAQLIWEKVGYGLKAIPSESKTSEEIEVVLENKCHVVHPNLDYGLLTDNSKKYFDKIATKNKYLISEKFSLQDYMKEFKVNQKQICKKWKQWIIKAEGDNVPVLLKLSWRLRKDLYLNVNIKVGVSNELPFAVLEIQPESDKEKRPKPDTSVVNNYLTN